jgi:hypothetical protein
MLHGISPVSVQTLHMYGHSSDCPPPLAVGYFFYTQHCILYEVWLIYPHNLQV